MHLSRIRFAGFTALLLFPSNSLFAQGATSPPDSTPPAPPPPSVIATSQSPGLPFAFSGVLYLNYQYGGPSAARSENRFDMDRAYLNFRVSSGSRDSIRVTLDVYQQRDATRDQYYRGWTMRVKYAYLNHDFIGGPTAGPAVTTGVSSSEALRIWGRIGLLQTVVIEKEEQFWNRGLSPAAVEQAGYFNSADAGVALGVSLPNRTGEIYATIVNGSGYGSRETDRFKDFQARLTLTPWARGTSFLRGLQLSPWFSSGGQSSAFASRRGTVQPVADARTRNRYGFLTTYRDTRLVAGLQLARKIDDAETADTTRDVAPTVREVTGTLMSAFAFWRPLGPAGSSPWQVLTRIDNIKPDDASSGSQRRYIVGASYDLSSRTSVTFDAQSLSPRNGLPGVVSRTYFLHFIANF